MKCGLCRYEVPDDVEFCAYCRATFFKKLVFENNLEDGFYILIVSLAMPILAFFFLNWIFNIEYFLAAIQGGNEELVFRMIFNTDDFDRRTDRHPTLFKIWYFLCVIYLLAMCFETCFATNGNKIEKCEYNFFSPLKKACLECFGSWVGYELFFCFLFK